MQLQTIGEKIKHVSQLQREDLALFEELKNKYPYSEIFQLIHLQLSHKFDSLTFEENLAKSAYKIRDRHKIYNIIESKETLHTLNDQLFEENKEVEIKESTDSTSTEEIKIEEKYTNEIIEKEIEQETENELSSLDTQIAAEAFSTIFSKDFEPTIQYKLEEDIQEEEIKIPIIEEIRTHSSSKDKNTSRSFTSWLKSNKTETKTDKNQLIDTVIATNPSISRTKKEFYSPSKQAIKSVDDEQLVYTETLAKILEMQGNFSKAISAYEQLSLTIPEKKTFFVQKIKELNEKLNSK